MYIDTDGAVQRALEAIACQLAELNRTLASVNHRLGVIMSEDAAVEAVVTDIQAQVANITAVMQQVSSTLASALAEAAAGGNTLSPQTVSDLQAAQATLDSAVSAAQAQAASEASQVTPPATPPADGSSTPPAAS